MHSGRRKNDKYIINIYKITSKEDKLKLFIGSTKEKLKSLLSFFIKDLNSNLGSNRKNHLYNWIRNLETSCLKIKLIKSYPVSGKEEQEEREKYWIKKYENYGYDVLHNPFKNSLKKQNLEKLYVCIENISMEEIVKTFGDKIISISKNGFEHNLSSVSSSFLPNSIPLPPPPPPQPSGNIQKPVNKKIQKPKNEKPKNNNDNSGGEGYLDELKNLLSKRNTSGLSLSKLTQKNKSENKSENKVNKKIKKNVVIKTNGSMTQEDFMKELVNKIKVIH